MWNGPFCIKMVEILSPLHISPISHPLQIYCILPKLTCLQGKDITLLKYDGTLDFGTNKNYQKVICETPHPPVCQDCPQNQCVPQYGDHLQNSDIFRVKELFLQNKKKGILYVYYTLCRWKFTNIMENAAVQI